MSASTIFSAPVATSSLKASSSTSRPRLLTPTVVYTLPSSANSQDIMNFMFLCALSCTSSSESAGEWKNLLATYVFTAFEGMLESAPRDQFTFTQLKSSQIEHMRNAMSTVIAAEDANENAENPHASTTLQSFAPAGIVLPRPAEVEKIGYLSYERDPKAMYAHLSLVVFLAGKLIDDKNRLSIIERRPKALIEKFKIESTGLLSGNLRISNTAHTQINQAWLEMTTLKAICFREFAAYTHKDTSLYEDIVLTTVNLMRNMQMQHAVLIYKFLLAYPWVRDFAPLRRFVALFDNSVESASKIEEHLQPFIKIIYGDKSGLFPRKDLEPLVACALASEESISETLTNYYHAEGFNSIVGAFKDERDAREVSIKSKEVEQVSAVPGDENNNQV